MERRKLKLYDDEKILYSNEFEVEVDPQTTLEVEAKYTLDICNEMAKLDEVENAMDLNLAYREIASKLFRFKDEGVDVTTQVSDITLVNTFVAYIQAYAEEIKEAVSNSNKPSRAPKGLQSKAPNKSNKPRTY